MYFLEVLLFLPVVAALVSVKIYTNSIYTPQSTCAFIGNVSFSNDASIQSCIGKCVHEDNCQTAVYFNVERICTMFTEFYHTDHIQSSGSVQANVIVYRKDHSRFCHFDEVSKTCSILDPVSTCPSSALSHQDIHTTLPDQLQSTAASTYVVFYLTEEHRYQ
jgi:hypothetical protein